MSGFVPRFGSERFRSFIGMTFWPYSLMNVSYAIIGSMLAPIVYWDRVIAIFIIYILALGIGAHALDAIGSGTKPWGKFLTNKQLAGLSVSSLIIALGIGSYYIITVTPLLIIIAVLEVFFLFAYNLEWFGKRFHTDKWFAVSWANLPVLAGYMIQTNSISFTAVLMSVMAYFTAYVEISASRPYRAIMKAGINPILQPNPTYYERILKSIVATVVILAITMAVIRLLD